MRGVLSFAISMIIAATFLGCGGGVSAPPPELASKLPTLESEKELITKEVLLPQPSALDIRFRNDEEKLVALKVGEKCEFRTKLTFESPQEYFVLKLMHVRNGADYGTTIIKPDRHGTTEFEFHLDSMPRPKGKGEFQLQVRALNQLFYEEQITAE